MNGKAQAGLCCRVKGVEGWEVKDIFKLSQYPFFYSALPEILSRKFHSYLLDFEEINAGEPGKCTPTH